MLVGLQYGFESLSLHLRVDDEACRLSAVARGLLMKTQEKLRYLEDRWDERVASALDDAELLRYRSNLLGSDLRITNFGGGNTSSKIIATRSAGRSPKNVLWIKGSGGDIGSIQRKGFATLYLEKLHALAGRYRGVDFEDEMVELYPLCAFGTAALRRRLTRRCTLFFLLSMWTICIRTGVLRWPRRRTAARKWKSSTALCAQAGLAALAAAWL